MAYTMRAAVSAWSLPVLPFLLMPALAPPAAAFQEGWENASQGTHQANDEFSVPCKAKASLKQKGGPGSTEPAQDRVRLSCELGPGLAAFPNLTEAFLENIEDAFAKRKTLKVDTKRGKLKFKTTGIESLPDDDQNVPLTCPSPAPEE